MYFVQFIFFLCIKDTNCHQLLHSNVIFELHFVAIRQQLRHFDGILIWIFEFVVVLDSIRLAVIQCLRFCVCIANANRDKLIFLHVLVDVDFVVLIDRLWYLDTIVLSNCRAARRRPQPRPRSRASATASSVVVADAELPPAPPPVHVVLELQFVAVGQRLRHIDGFLVWHRPSSSSSSTASSSEFVQCLRFFVCIADANRD
jgi:hypothetical protein